MTEIQKRDLFLNIMRNFSLSEGVFSSFIQLTEDELSPEARDYLKEKTRMYMLQQQRLYYYFKIGHSPEYFTVINDLELIDRKHRKKPQQTNQGAAPSTFYPLTVPNLKKQ